MRLEIAEGSRDSFSEVIIGMSSVAEAMITAAFVLSLFLIISYGNKKGLVISDC
jgi:hypothetical protein